MSKSTQIATSQVLTPSSNKNKKLRKSTSLKIASTFTRVCLCAPIYSYNEVSKAKVPPRRSNTYPRSKPPLQTTTHERIPIHSARLSKEGGRVVQGESLTGDVLMWRFGIEEEAVMPTRRINQMEAITKSSTRRRKKLKPSPLSRMVMANEIGQFN
ncbi:hypothetical protein TanjilG_26007 [Lupinus angustifolius]|uniref:Uncharacterized protein n=2 Tax=Lupinus angustifolius TaxID=3871 RepID=A0A1J7GUG5_LUPAN|nr:hypothetical protein TanjilG_26007 [Lupinus angustifolius]